MSSGNKAVKLEKDVNRLNAIVNELLQENFLLKQMLSEYTQTTNTTLQKK